MMVDGQPIEEIARETRAKEHWVKRRVTYLNKELARFLQRPPQAGQAPQQEPGGPA
jgi:hypothetical protein